MEEVIQNFQKELLQRHPQYPQYKEILYGIETHPNPSPTIFSADSLLQGSNIMELEAIDRHIHIWRRTFDSAKVRLFCTKTYMISKISKQPVLAPNPSKIKECWP